MPLRDHFHAPLKERRHWDGFHSSWLGEMVRQLSIRLPAGYFAEPQVHLGVQVEPDVGTFEEEETLSAATGSGDGVATAVWAPSRPTQTLDVDLPAQDVFEVRVYDESQGIRLVAAVELVSPRNKDRPESRRAFAVKCASYLQECVSVIVVDVVTDRHDDLYEDVLALVGRERQGSWPGKPPLYALALRTTKVDQQWRLETWEESLLLGQALPTMPLWLASDLAVPLELDATYEETCRVLRIG
jgi:hypothetical protein